MVYIHAKSNVLCVHLDNMVHASMHKSKFDTLEEINDKTEREHAQEEQHQESLYELHSLRKQYLEKSYKELINNETPFMLLDAMMLLLHFMFTNNKNSSHNTNQSKIVYESSSFKVDCTNVQSNIVEIMEKVKLCKDTNVIKDFIKECKNLYSDKSVITNCKKEKSIQEEDDDDDDNSRQTDSNKLQSKYKLFTITLHALTKRTAHQEEMLLSSSLLVAIFGTLELLWCLKYIIRQVKNMNSKRRQTLIGHALECNNGSEIKNTEDEAENWERQCSYFHDDVVLLPFSFLNEFICTWNKYIQIRKEQHEEIKCNNVQESTQMANMCKYDTTTSVYDLLNVVQATLTSETSEELLLSSSAQSGNNENEEHCTNIANEHFSIVINPAISINDNPQRRMKNVRVAAIEDAAIKFFYDQLAFVASDNKSTSIFASRSSNKMDNSRTMRLKEISVIDPTQYSTQVTFHHNDQYKRQQYESFGTFMSNACIGFDIYIMSLSAAGAGFYLAYMLNKSIEVCLVCATVALVIMLFVDALLLLTRIGKEDMETNKSKRQRARARAKYTGTSQNKFDSTKIEHTLLEEIKTPQGNHNSTNNCSYVKKVQ